MATPSKTEYTTGPDEKVVPVMVYTANYLYLGDIIVKNIVRVNTWLRTNMAPDIIHLYHARCVPILTGDTSKLLSFTELFVPTIQVNAFHIMPPATEAVDYDQNEPNRRMEPISAIVGPFRMDGSIRIATKSDLSKFIELAHETFSALYEVDISHPGMPSFRTIRVPFLLVRQNVTTFASRS
jgi:hypothetical protein